MMRPDRLCRISHSRGERPAELGGGRIGRIGQDAEPASPTIRLGIIGMEVALEYIEWSHLQDLAKFDHLDRRYP